MSDSDDTDSSNEIESAFSGTCEMIEQMLKEVSTLESRLKTMHRPLQNLHLDQLGDLEFLKGSSFRQTEFKFSSAAAATLVGLDASKRHAFQDIVKQLRHTIILKNLVREDGVIVLTKPMQKMFETKEKELTFPGLLGCLRAVLV